MNMPRANRVRMTHVFGFLCLMLIFAVPPVLAGTPPGPPPAIPGTNWTGGAGDGLWSNAGNWTYGVPATGYFAQINGAGIVTYDSTDNPPLYALGITCDGSGISTVLHQSANSLTLGGNYILLINGTNGGYAAYELSSTGTLVKINYQVLIGTTGTGNFNQSGGTFQFSGYMLLGENATGHGIYTMTGGDIAAGPNGAGGIVLGDMGGRGDFEQSGGTVTIGSLMLGYWVGSAGNYAISGGPQVSLAVDGPVVIGRLGSGGFTQDGGNHIINGDLSIGVAPGGVGLYDLNSGNLTVTGNVVIGSDAGGSGSFTQSGGTHSIGGDLVIAEGAYFLDGGSLALAGN